MNAYYARLAEATGFKALYISGGGVIAGSCGVPDLGITTMKEVIKCLLARNVIANTTPCADFYVRVARSIVYTLDNIDVDFREIPALAKA